MAGYNRGIAFVTAAMNFHHRFSSAMTMVTLPRPAALAQTLSRLGNVTVVAPGARPQRRLNSLTLDRR